MSLALCTFELPAVDYSSMFVCSLFNDAVSNSGNIASNDSMTVNDELGGAQKQMIVIKFKVLWRMDPLIGKELETNNETTAIAMQRHTNTPLQ
jgi:hypothetical protein